MSINLTLILLMIASIASVILLILITKSANKNQLRQIFSLNVLSVLICLLGQILQLAFADRYNINPIYFDYFVYIGTCFLPVTVFLTGLVFQNTKIKFSKKYLLLFLIPIISLIILWTNDFHNLFYKVYSVNLEECVYGDYMVIHNIYSYAMLFLGIYLLIKFSIKNSGFFSKQSLLFVIAMSIPITVNLLGVVRIIPMTIYYTSISFTITIVCCALAIFKFNFLGAAPIALQKIVDRISDSYIVLGEDNNIVDFNKTFIDTFKLKGEKIRGKNFIKFFNENKKFKINMNKIEKAIEKARNEDKVISFEIKIEKINKYFMVEVTNINSNTGSLGILVLFKDITQHKEDIETIQDKQEQLMEKERLSSLGQLVGGIAHNLKTPIMSIAGAAEGILDLVKEYDSSVGDPEVTIEDHHEIASEMMEWVKKIKTHTEYMSDVITAVKGQAVALSEDTNMTFTVDELTKRVDILMKHELKHAIVYLNIVMNVDKYLELRGDVNSLVQVINNMISNSIQAYNGKPEQSIDMIINKEKNNLIISIKDYASGLPKVVKEKLFKEMITTKGKNGTGLGLYMSYSNIRAHFGGNITVESEEGKGTTFNIILPLQR